MPSSQNILVIAEKPSVAANLANWLAKHGKSVGFNIGSGQQDKKKTYTTIGDVNVTFCVGHVLEMKMPEDYSAELRRWRLADLPIIPGRFELKIKPSTEAQVRAIDHLLKTATRVIHAGDPDDEGQLLVSEVLEFFDYTGPVDRLWLNAIDDASIAKAFAAMRPDAEYRGYYESAKARSTADWLVGINFTRATTVVGRQRGAQTVLSVGRVQTPTLGLIVRREREIQNFKPAKYFVPWLTLASNPDFRADWRAPKDDDRLDDQGRLADGAAVEKIMAAAKSAGEAVVKKYAAEKKSEPAPLSFSLARLQMHMSSKYGMGAKEVLDVAQRLYEKKKISSYPRTDCEYLIESQHSEAKAILSSLVGFDATIDKAIAKANPDFRSYAWNSSKATAHHGIIPLRITGSMPSLDAQERRVFAEIVKRYCLQFWPVAQYMAISIEVGAGGETYGVSGRAYINKGWRLAFSGDETEDAAEADEAEPGSSEAALPELVVGDTLKIKAVGSKDGTTRPPSRYTEGTLIEAMKNAHRFVSSDKLKKILKEQTGIGTEATRASIITNLKDKGYIKAIKKNIAPTELGEKLFDALPAMLTTVDLTAFWQQEMDEMRQGKGEHQAFVAKQSEMVKKMLPAICQSVEKSTFGEVKPRMEEKETVQCCPSCGGKLRHLNGRYGWLFACQTEECKEIFKDVDGNPVKSRRAEDSGHKCPACKKAGLLAMDGKNGKYLKCANEKCAQTFNVNPDGSPEKYYACPACKKGHLSKRTGAKGAFWGCSNFKNGCRHTAEDDNGAPAEKKVAT